METISALLALCAGNSPITGDSPHKGQWRGALMFSLIYAWINGWVNNRETGDLRRHRALSDAIVMKYTRFCILRCGWDLNNTYVSTDSQASCQWFPPFIINKHTQISVLLEFRDPITPILRTIFHNLQLSDILFLFMLKKYILCKACGLRCPSFQSSNVLYISPIYTFSMQELICKSS